MKNRRQTLERSTETSGFALKTKKNYTQIIIFRAKSAEHSGSFRLGRGEMKCGGCDRGLNNSASPRGKSLGCRPWPWLPTNRRRQFCRMLRLCVCGRSSQSEEEARQTRSSGGSLSAAHLDDSNTVHVSDSRSQCVTASFTTVCRQTRRAGIHLQLQLFSFLVHLPSSQENQLPIAHPTASPLLLCFRQQNNQRVRMSAHV